MSGGVDSAVAAARAVEAGPRGHRRAPGAVRATRSRSAPARAAAARSRTPATPAAPPTCSASRSTSGTWPSGSARTSSRLRRRVRRRAHPQPVPALQREDQVRRGAGPGASRSASTRCAPATTPRIVRTARLHRAVDPAKDQSYVLAVLTPRAARRAMFPLGDIDQGRGARRGGRSAGWPSPTSPTPTTSASSPTATPAASCADRLGAAPGADRRRRPARCSASTRALTASPSASARAADRHPGRRRPAALRARHLAGHQHRHRRARPTARADEIGPPRRSGPAARRDGRLRCMVQIRAHGEAHPCDRLARWR